MIPITKTDFDAANQKHPYLNGRWGYYREAIRLALELGPTSVLEIGPGPLPLFKDGLCFDCDFKTTGNVVRWDASSRPWPMGNQCVDIVVALQVWEHLGTKQSDAFLEVTRVARKGVILSLPWKWQCADPTDIHHNIGEETVREWTGRDYDLLVIVPPKVSPRAIYVYRW